MQCWCDGVLTGTGSEEVCSVVALVGSAADGWPADADAAVAVLLWLTVTDAEEVPLAEDDPAVLTVFFFLDIRRSGATNLWNATSYPTDNLGLIYMKMGLGLLGMLKFYAQVWLGVTLQIKTKDGQKVIKVKKEGVTEGKREKENISFS